jgi:hypothetical protein
MIGLRASHFRAALVPLGFLGFLGFILSGCSPPEPEPRLATDPIATGAQPPADGAATYALAHPPADPPALAAVRSEPVEGLTGPGGEPFEVTVRGQDRFGHDRPIGRQSFQISLRGGATAEHACVSCHAPGRGVIGPDRQENAHRYVLPRHPERSGSACATCHAPDDVEKLVLADGHRVPLAHAYQLCGQCHYPQVEAWAAGVHGKRLDGWRGRRVLMGCADCHDPHQPALSPRDPFPGPQLPRTGGRTP